MESSRRNRSEIVLHIVWTTWKRQPLVTEEIEPAIYRTIQAEAAKLGCTVLALSGMPDHVHLIVVIPPQVSTSTLMQQVKGVSSSVARELLGSQRFFQWNNGYAVFSLSRAHCEAAIAYVQRQKEHHVGQRVWDEWEWTPTDPVLPLESPRLECRPPPMAADVKVGVNRRSATKAAAAMRVRAAAAMRVRAAAAILAEERGLLDAPLHGGGTPTGATLQAGGVLQSRQ